MTQSRVRNGEAHEINFLGRSQYYNERYKSEFVESGGWYYSNGNPESKDYKLETFAGAVIPEEIVMRCGLNPSADIEYSCYLQQVVHSEGFAEKLSYFLRLFWKSSHFKWMLHYEQACEGDVYSLLTPPEKPRVARRR